MIRIYQPLRESSMMAKYDITVELVGHDGNAFSIMGAVTKAMRRAGVSREEQDQYFKEATAGDYNQLLATTMEWVEVS
jgi:ribosomal protein S9